jgi:hypothetical protein
MSDPKNPRVVKTLTGVSSVYSEDGRQLIYMTNSDGLWVIKHYETFRLPFCTTGIIGEYRRSMSANAAPRRLNDARPWSLNFQLGLRGGYLTKVKPCGTRCRKT